jgi:serine/threonine protein phosphatase PrpC
MPGHTNLDIFGPISLERGDLVLLCSDGLYGMMGDDVIATILEECPIEIAATELVQEANRRGGLDNISAVVATWET